MHKYIFILGGFMGDIALPETSYDDYPVVAHTTIGKVLDTAPSREAIIKFNDTFQKEMEILKQEVYHEGLQVEEEGLTDIIRRKTKLPSIKPELNTDFFSVS